MLQDREDQNNSHELGHRNPKDDKLDNIAQALDVNVLALKDPTLFSAEEVMFLLFELEQHYPVGLHEIKVAPDTNGPSTQIGITFEQKLMNDLLKEWILRKQELKEGKISQEEYNEWKWNWPATCDNCGRMEPKRNGATPEIVTTIHKITSFFRYVVRNEKNSLEMPSL